SRFGPEFETLRLRRRMLPRRRIHLVPVGFGDPPGVEVDEGLRQRPVTRLMRPQEGTQGQRAMRRGLLLDRDADPERRVAADIEGRKAFAQPARAGKQIDNAESGWQIRGLSNSGCRLYTRSGRRGQEANGGYRRQADPLADDVRDPGQGHEAGNGAEACVARARLPVSAGWKG